MGSSLFRMGEGWQAASVADVPPPLGGGLRYTSTHNCVDGATAMGTAACREVGVEGADGLSTRPRCREIGRTGPGRLLRIPAEPRRPDPRVPQGSGPRGAGGRESLVERTKLFEQALGLEHPWHMEKAEFDPKARRLDLHLNFEAGEVFECGGCRLRPRLCPPRYAVRFDPRQVRRCFRAVGDVSFGQSVRRRVQQGQRFAGGRGRHLDRRRTPPPTPRRQCGASGGSLSSPMRSSTSCQSSFM